MREIARALALLLDKEIANREAALKSLGSSSPPNPANLRDFYDKSLKVARAWNGMISLSDSTGQQSLNTLVPLETGNLPVMRSSVAARKDLGTDATVVSNVFLGPYSKQYSFTVQVPVVNTDGVQEYLAMGTFASQLQSLFKDQRMPASWTGSIVDRNGIIAARSKDPEKFVGTRSGDQIRKKILSMAEGFNEGPTLSGEQVIAAFSRAPVSGWTFIVSVPREEVISSSMRSVSLLGAVSVFLLMIAAVIALMVGRITAKPIESLRRSAERLRQGEVLEPAVTGITEMDDVHAELVRASRAIAGAKTELEQRVREAVSATERSERALLQAQKLEALGRLTGGIAHDFNNVLQTLSTGMQVARLSPDPARREASLTACENAVRRASELTGRLLAFGRVQPARFESVDLGEQLSRMMPLLRGALPGDIAFDIELDKDLWNVTIDTLQLELALLNLAFNARDAMPDGGRMKLTVNNESLAAPSEGLEAGDYVRVCMSDSGIGMSPDVARKAIEPFFTTKEVGKGSGLGLAQVYGFARQSNGGLQLNSTKGVGTAISIFLPRSHSRQMPLVDTHRAERRASRRQSVLFVEDDVLVRDVVGPALEALDFVVTIAPDGAAALALLDGGRRFDVMFSDVVMPGEVSGLQLAHVVRERFPEMRVILATGYSERQISVPGVPILAKPYEVEEVVAAIDALDAQRMSG